MKKYLEMFNYINKKINPLPVQDKINTINKNKTLWQQYDWTQFGEEWTVSAEWKQSIIEHVMYRYIKSYGTTLEIGPGAGRWTEYLYDRSNKLIVVDISEKCIELCKKRFNNVSNITYFVNNGTNLEFINDNTLDFIWSFDVFVHIIPSDTEKYIKQFAKKMKSEAIGIIHHPNSGGIYGGNRSSMTTEKMSKLFNDNDLKILKQFNSWGDKEEFNVKFHDDMITLFTRI